MKQIRLAGLLVLAIMLVLACGAAAGDNTSPAKSAGERPVVTQPASDEPDEADESDELDEPDESDESDADLSAPEKSAEEAAKKAVEAGKPKPEQLYTACNLWYERPNRISSINYKRGIRIRPGTPVRDVRIDVGTAGRLRGKAVIHFVRKRDGKLFTLIFEPRYHPKDTIEDYKMRVFSTKDFEGLTKGFTETELRAIQAGKLKIGMSKAAVLVAWGPPPKHKTPSLEANVWTYWLSRVPNWIKKVHFDSHGKTVRPPEENREPDDL